MRQIPQTPHALHRQAPTRPPLPRDVLLTSALLLRSQEYTSDFQAKYQKLLVRDLGGARVRALLREPLQRSCGLSSPV